MTWFRIDDAMPDHPKLRKIPRRYRSSALALWVGSGCWCARHLTDGIISTETALELGHGPLGQSKATAFRSLSELIRVGLWTERDQKEIGFHHWSEYQPSRASVLDRREKTRKRVAKSRAGNAVTNAAPGPARPDQYKITHTNAGAREAQGPPLPEPPDELAGGPAAKPTRLLVLREFNARFEAATGTGWASARFDADIREAARVIDRTATLHQVEPEAVLAQSLDGFFADEWAAEHDFPFSNFLKYMTNHARKGAA